MTFRAAESGRELGGEPIHLQTRKRWSRSHGSGCQFIHRSPLVVHRLAYNGDIAAGQLAVFQGASEAPIFERIRAERATRKNSQLAAAPRVVLKMGRRLRCSSVTYQFRYAPSSRLAGGPF